MKMFECWAVAFYDQDNQLIGSFGLEEDPPEDKIEAFAYSMMMDGLSVDEYDHVAYFKIEKHYNVIR
jgi:RimJ/RimL family protein N-acetyltransferase